MKTKTNQIKILIIFLVIIHTINIFAKDRFDIDARFSFGGNNEIAKTDYYFLHTDLEFEFRILDNLECTLTLEADRFEVEAEEISIKWKIMDYATLLLGKFENALTLDEYMPAHKRIFAKKSSVSEYIDDLGYINSNFGLKVYKKYNKKTLPISYFLQGTFNSSDIEPQFDLGFFYHYNKKKSYLGILISYFPFITHDFWLEENADTEKHNILVDLICADYEHKIVYGTELTFGSNLIDPLGIVHTPGTRDRSFFFGGDTHVGYRLSHKNFIWLPALRFSILFPELTTMDCNQMQIKLGNLFSFYKKVYLHADFGLGINTQYSGNTLYTNLEFLWAVNITVKI